MLHFYRLGGFLLSLATLLSAADTRLVDAAAREDTTAVRALLREKIDVNAPAADGTTALHWLVRAEDAATADLLIHAGANVKAADRYGITPLFLACSNGDAAMIRKLIDAGADPNSADASGETALMTATGIGSIEAMRVLLDKGANVNATEPNWKSTALMLAVRQNQPDAVRLLLERGALVNARTRTGEKPPRRPAGAGGGSHGVGIIRGGLPETGSQTPIPGAMSALLYATRDGRMDIVRLLLAAKADVNQAEANGITPLQMAIGNGHIPLSEYLLDHGADVNAADAYGRAPLWLAVELRDLELDRAGRNTTDRPAALQLIRLLLDKGANVNARWTDVPPNRRYLMPLGDLSWVNFIGQTPFLRAALSGDIAVMRLLLDKGADPNLPTVEGTTALMAAAGVNWVVAQTYTESNEAQLEAVKLCLEKGADVNAANSMGLTAVHGAANRGADAILEYLVSKGAKLDVKDKEGRTPMVWAEGVFLATNAPERKPATIALIEKLLNKVTAAR